MQLFERILPTCSLQPDEAWSRGRKTLFDAITSLKDVRFAAGETSADKHVAAQSVDPSRISLPERVGTVDPLKFLCPERQHVLDHLDALVLPEDRWPSPLPRPCHMVSPKDEAAVNQKMIDSKMAVLVDESLIPRGGDGRKLLSGLFCVPHKLESDRLIFDRRPGNATESRLSWITLPHGTQMCQLRLKPGEHVRASADDISNYFYHLKLPDNAGKRSGFGQVITGGAAVKLGGLSSGRYHLVSCVWNMGDHNAVDVAQATHEEVLIKGGALKMNIVSSMAARCRAVGFLKALILMITLC